MERLPYSRAPDLSAVLKNHAARYPKLSPQDAVKLLFQSVFGPGHLISDPEAASDRLNNVLK